MMDNSEHLRHQTRNFVGICATQSYGMRPWPLLIHRGTLNNGHALIVELKLILLRTAHCCLFMTACNAINHLIAEHPDLQYVGTSTMSSAQETYVTSSISVCPARAPTLISPAQTGDHQTSTSEVQFMPWQSLVIECDQSCNTFI